MHGHQFGDPIHEAGVQFARVGQRRSRLSHLRQARQFGDACLLLGIELGIANGDGGLPGHRFEQSDIRLSVGVAIKRCKFERADQFIVFAIQQGHADRGLEREVYAIHLGPHVKAALDVADQQSTFVAGNPTRVAFVELIEADAPIERDGVRAVARAGAGPEHLGIGFPEIDLCQIVLHDAPDGLQNRVEGGVKIKTGRNRSTHFGQGADRLCRPFITAQAGELAALA